MAFDNIKDEQLIRMHRELVDRISILRKEIAPLLDEFDNVKNEFLKVNAELESRLGILAPRAEVNEPK